MLLWIALFGHALVQLSRFRDEIHFGRETPKHANAPIETQRRRMGEVYKYAINHAKTQKKSLVSKGLIGFVQFQYELKEYALGAFV